MNQISLQNHVSPAALMSPCPVDADVRIDELVEQLRVLDREWAEKHENLSEEGHGRYSDSFDALYNDLLATVPTGLYGLLAKANGALGADAIDVASDDELSRAEIAFKAVRDDLARLIVAGEGIASQEGADPLVALWAEWERLHVEQGVAERALDRKPDDKQVARELVVKSNACCERITVIADEIERTPATSLEGVAVRRRLAEYYLGYPDCSDGCKRAALIMKRADEDVARLKVAAGDAASATGDAEIVRLLEQLRESVRAFNDAPGDMTDEQFRRHGAECNRLRLELDAATPVSLRGVIAKMDAGISAMEVAARDWPSVALLGAREDLQRLLESGAGVEPMTAEDRAIIDTAKRAAELEAEEIRFMETGEDDDPRQISDTRIALDCMLVEEMKPNTVAGLMAKAERLLTIVGSYEGGVWRTRPDTEKTGPLDTAMIAWSIGQDLQRMFGDQKAAPAENPDARLAALGSLWADAHREWLDIVGPVSRPDPAVLQPALDNLDKIEAEIKATPAKTAAGFAIKLRVACAHDCDNGFAPGEEPSFDDRSSAGDYFRVTAEMEGLGFVPLPTTAADETIRQTFEERNALVVDHMASEEEAGACSAAIIALDDRLLDAKAHTPYGLAVRLWTLALVRGAFRVSCSSSGYGEDGGGEFASQTLTTLHDHCAMHGLSVVGALDCDDGVRWVGSCRGTFVEVDDPAKINAPQNAAETNGRAA